MKHSDVGQDAEELSVLASRMQSGEQSEARVDREAFAVLAEALTDDFDAAMNTPNLPSWQIRVVLDGIRVLPALYERNRMLKVSHERIVDRSELNRLAAKGATILMDDAQSAIRRVADLCASITSATGQAAAGTIFASAAHSEGFGLHQDAEDVIVIQLAGSKSWQVYEPIAASESSMLRRADTGNLVFDGSLQAGDALVMPKGSPHKTSTNSNEGSLHLTIGIYPVSVRDVLSNLIAQVPEHDLLDSPVQVSSAVEKVQAALANVKFEEELVRSVVRSQSSRLVADPNRFELHRSQESTSGGSYRVTSTPGNAMKNLLAVQLGRAEDEALDGIVEFFERVGRGGIFHYKDLPADADDAGVREEVVHALLRMRMLEHAS